MRYRLRTMLIAVIICAFIANAIASERNASRQVLELDASVMTALKKITPEVSERFDIDYLFAPSDVLSGYSLTRVTHSASSVLTGPRFVLYDIYVDDQASIAVNIEATWYYLNYGKPKILIDFSPSRGNQWLARKLEAELAASVGAQVKTSKR